MAVTPSAESLEQYFRGIFPGCRLLEFKPIGKGVHGAGYGVSLMTQEGKKDFVLKDISPGGLGHDYPSDRAAVLLLALENYGNLPLHVKALDVLSLQGDGTLKAVGGGKEYFLLMEEAKGVSYFKDLEGFSKKDRLDEKDREKIRLMAAYLAEIHSVKKDSKALYLRKLRDIIGHGECLMGVFDTYPDGVLSHKEMAAIEKKCLDWRAALKGKWKRLSQIHGDFHPGNIWWGGRTPPLHGRQPSSKAGGMTLLDRSRGEWGEPADDVTALTINYVFFSIKRHDSLCGPYLEGLKLFFRLYIESTGDTEILEVPAPFYAFRGAVVANPIFYPELSVKQRAMIFDFVRGVLEAERFDPERADEYMK